MMELLSKFDSGELIGLVAVAGAFLCGVPAVIMGIWLAIRQTEMAAALKQEMLNRGMSAEEIRIVLEAGSGQAHKGVCGRHSCRA
jgi:hypothetical protein